MNEAELLASVESALKEKVHLKRTARFFMLLAEADPAGLQRIQSALGNCYKKGWETGEFGEMVSAKEGGFLGESGMNEILLDWHGCWGGEGTDR